MSPYRLVETSYVNKQTFQMGEDEEGQIRIKSEDNVQYVRIELAEGEGTREWLKMVKSEASE